MDNQIKVASARTGNKMAPEIIAFIERRVQELEKETT